MTADPRRDRDESIRLATQRAEGAANLRRQHQAYVDAGFTPDQATSFCQILLFHSLGGHHQ